MLGRPAPKPHSPRGQNVPRPVDFRCQWQLGWRGRQVPCDGAVVVLIRLPAALALPGLAKAGVRASIRPRGHRVRSVARAKRAPGHFRTRRIGETAAGLARSEAISRYSAGNERSGHLLKPCGDHPSIADLSARAGPDGVAATELLRHFTDLGFAEMPTQRAMRVALDCGALVLGPGLKLCAPATRRNGCLGRART